MATLQNGNGALQPTPVIRPARKQTIAGRDNAVTQHASARRERSVGTARPQSTFNPPDPERAIGVVDLLFSNNLPERDRRVHRLLVDRQMLVARHRV